LSIGVAVLVFSLPAIVVAALRWGARRGGAWLLVHAVYLLAGSAITHRRLLPGLGHEWLLKGHRSGRPWCPLARPGSRLGGQRPAMGSARKHRPGHGDGGDMLAADNLRIDPAFVLAMRTLLAKKVPI